MEIKPYQTPAFLTGETADTIYTRMTEIDVGNGRKVKELLDVSQGSMFWDTCRPSAIEKEGLIQYQINETIKAGFPQFATEADLDNHGQTYGVERRQAAKAEVTLMVTGKKGTFIPAGFRFATPTVGDEPGVEFATLADATIGENGTIQIDAEAVVAGANGSVQAELISLQVQLKDGITSVNNAADATGGADIEEDDDYRQRILEAMAKNPGSGSKYDYIRWAKEVPGVGDAQCIPEWLGAGTGTVKVVVVDLNGAPASQTVLDRVKVHICGPNGDDGPAPTGAIVMISAPLMLIVNVNYSAKLASGFAIDGVSTAFGTALATYYKNAVSQGIVRYHELCAILIGLDGVDDYTALTTTISDTIVSYTAATKTLVLTNGFPGILAGDKIKINGTDYTVSTYTHATKTAVLSSGPASISNYNVIITLGSGTKDINLTVEYYPVTGAITGAVAP